jgi:hypothetical protein
LRRFYDLQPVDAAPVDWKRFHAATDIVRRQTLLEPTVGPECNARALPLYYTIGSFEAREDNDYLVVDGVLGGLTEPVSIEICVEPADTHRDLSAHTVYLAHLQPINRAWDPADGEVPDLQWRRHSGSAKPLSRSEPAVLRMKEPQVDEVLRQQQRFHETLPLPHLRFSIRVMAPRPAMAHLVATVVADSAFENGSYQLFDSSRGDPDLVWPIDGEQGLRVAPIDALKRLLGDRKIDLYERQAGLAHVAPVEEFASVFRLPVASFGSPCCIRKSSDPLPEKPEDLIILGYEERPDEGRTARTRPGIPRGIRVDRLTTHLTVTGTSGSGKSMGGKNLVYQLLRRNIPFIVFEPVKTDYRVLKCLRGHPDAAVRHRAQELRIYTPGNEEVSPIRWNPLRIPEGISRSEHIENLLTCFKAAMPMTGPLPALLSEALEEVYEDHPDPHYPPRMADLYAAARKVLARKGYSGEVDSDLRGALEVRLGILTRLAIGLVFQCGDAIPGIDELIRGFSIIELEALPREQACLVMLFLLTAIRERIRTTPNPGRGVRLVLVIEEAHNLVGRNHDARASEENADPRAFASDFVCLMLAELRAMGVAMVIIDQLPCSIAPEVLKNTGSALTFREVESEERAAIGGAMLFGPIEMAEVARLRPGEAYLFIEGYFGPRRVRTPNLDAELNLPAPPFGKDILLHIREDRWFVEAAAARASAELGSLRLEMDRFEDARAALSGAMKSLLQEKRAARKVSEPDRRKTLLQGLARKAAALRGRLQEALRRFERHSYRPLMGGWSKENLLDDGLKKLCAQLSRRFEEMSRQGTLKYMERLEGMARRFLRAC